MDLTIVIDYVSPIILIACLVVGWIIKNLIPNESVNRFIPLIVAVLGIVLNIWSCGWIVDLPTVVTGAVSGLASTGLYEAFTQIIGSVGGKLISEEEGELENSEEAIG